MKKVNVINADEKINGTKSHMIGFGSVGTTWCLVFAYSIEDALEDAAQWLADKELFGHITPHDRGLDELGCDCADPYECESHTYTEAGWLTSHEWFVIGENMSRNQIISFAHERNNA
jgi:hypothetical protein